MKNYPFLIKEIEEGRFAENMRRGLYSNKLYLWLDVYAYHLAHPSLSSYVVGDKFGIDPKHVRTIYRYMEAD